MAYRAGAALMNLEFKQIFPGVVHPTINHFSAWFFVLTCGSTTRSARSTYTSTSPGHLAREVYKQRGSHGPFSARDSARAILMSPRSSRRNRAVRTSVMLSMWTSPIRGGGSAGSGAAGIFLLSRRALLNSQSSSHLLSLLERRSPHRRERGSTLPGLYARAKPPRDRTAPIAWRATC